MLTKTIRISEHSAQALDNALPKLGLRSRGHLAEQLIALYLPFFLEQIEAIQALTQFEAIQAETEAQKT